MATQAERRSSTRAKLLDAATACLIEDGYRSLTTTAVVKRAGSSQGALFTYFANKNELVAAMVEHLFAQLRAEFEASFHALAARESVSVAEALELLASSMSDRRYHAALDLYAAARTDRDLQAGLTPVVERHGALVWELAASLPLALSAGERAPFDALVRLALMALQGAAIQVQARPDEPAPADVVEALRIVAGIEPIEDAP